HSLNRGFYILKEICRSLITFNINPCIRRSLYMYSQLDDGDEEYIKNICGDIKEDKLPWICIRKSSRFWYRALHPHFISFILIHGFISLPQKLVDRTWS